MKVFHRAMTIAVSVALLAAASLANAAENRRVKIVNKTSSSIFYLYATNVGNRDWGSDILGVGSSIRSGYEMTINFDDGTGTCYFDLKAVLRDGRTATRMNLNVCTTADWTIYEN